MIAFLVTLILLAIFIYAVYVILSMINLPPPIKTLVYLLVAVILLLVVLDQTGLYHVAWR